MAAIAQMDVCVTLEYHGLLLVRSALIKDGDMKVFGTSRICPQEPAACCIRLLLQNQNTIHGVSVVQKSSYAALHLGRELIPNGPSKRLY
jgi:hypothetical protein